MTNGQSPRLPDASFATGPKPTTKNLKLLFVVTEDWYFCSHRLDLAQAAKAAGYDVAVACRVTNHAKQIEEAGVRLLPLKWDRSNNGLATQINDIRSLTALYRKERPDICHHVALKPIVLGGLAARICRIPRVISAVAGLGSAFVMQDVRARVLRHLIGIAIGAVANRPGWHFVFQNPDDRDSLISLGAADPKRVTIIPGAGVDTDRFEPFQPSRHEPMKFAVVSRMLTIKGIEDAVEASKILHARGVSHRLLLCGAPDPSNRACIPDYTLETWNELPTVSWLGHINDVRSIWRVANVALQPSLGGEGLPKSLLEAAACGRAIIATDVPGNREIAKHQKNALLVPIGDPCSLADAMQSFVSQPSLVSEFGCQSRIFVENNFSAKIINRLTRKLYDNSVSQM